MNPADYVFFALMSVWVVGDVLIFLRYTQEKRSYLRYFPPDTYFGVMWVRQVFPELERRRRKVWWRFAQFQLWMWGFPMLASGVTLALIPALPH
jgi:hypothetical protein